MEARAHAKIEAATAATAAAHTVGAAKSGIGVTAATAHTVGAAAHSEIEGAAAAHAVEAATHSEIGGNNSKSTCSGGNTLKN